MTGKKTGEERAGRDYDILGESWWDGVEKRQRGRRSREKEEAARALMALTTLGLVSACLQGLQPLRARVHRWIAAVSARILPAGAIQYPLPPCGILPSL